MAKARHCGTDLFPCHSGELKHWDYPNQSNQILSQNNLKKIATVKKEMEIKPSGRAFEYQIKVHELNFQPCQSPKQIKDHVESNLLMEGS